MAVLPVVTSLVNCSHAECVLCSGGVRIGPGRPQRSWLHRLTATPMRTTSGQNWLQVMRSQAAQPGDSPAADVAAPSPVPQLRVAGLPGQNMVSFPPNACTAHSLLHSHLQQCAAATMLCITLRISSALKLLDVLFL